MLRIIWRDIVTSSAAFCALFLLAQPSNAQDVSNPDVVPRSSYSTVGEPPPPPTERKELPPQLDPELSKRGRRVPKSDTELFKIGKSAYKNFEFAFAKKAFELLMKTYPASTFHLRSQFYVGACEHGLRNYDLAEEVFKGFIQASSHTTEGFQARVLLGDTYIQRGKYHEALATAYELLHQPKLAIEFQLEGLLIKTRAFLKLNKLIDADRTLSHYQLLVKKQRYGRLWLAKGWEVELQKKNYECDRLPSAGPLNEAEVRDQMKRKGVCLLESVTILEKLLRTNEGGLMTLGSNLTREKFRAFTHACLNPPSPRSNLSQSQIKQYQLELRTVLIEDCLKTIDQTAKIVQQWKWAKQSEQRTSALSFIDVLNQSKQTLSSPL